MPEARPHSHRSFLQLLAVLFFIWCLYRFIFINVPVVLEETVGKLIFYALPVWLYVVFTQAPLLYEELRPKKVLPGLFLGLLFGGVLGLVATFAVLTGKSNIQIAPVFLSSAFWWEFFLGVMTGFWESLFFFGWVFGTTELAFPKWHLLKVIAFNTFVFVVYHLPNTILRYPTNATLPFNYFVSSQIFLLMLFAIGQGFLYYKYRNIYLLALTHAFWGTILLVFG